MTKDLRSFIDLLEAEAPQEIVRVKKEVDPKLELCGVLQRLEEQGRFPAVIFEKVKGSKFSVISNVYGSLLKTALAVDCKSFPEACMEYVRREERPILPKIVEYGPVKEVVLKGDDVDLSRFPIVTHNEKDAGPYVTTGISFVKDPDSDVVNIGIYRHQLKGKRKLGIMINPAHLSAYYLRRYEEINEPMELALVIGHHPAVGMAAVGKIRPKLDVAGGLLGEPLELVKCETINLYVPAYAEMVIEGVVDPSRKEPEGPFGEYAWYYGERKFTQSIDIRAVTHRSDMIFHDLFSAHPDHNVICILSGNGTIYRAVKEAVPSTRAVHLPLSGVARFWCFISIKKRVEGEATRAAFAAFNAEPNTKHVVVVDDDINVYNESEVLWALATRFQADRQLTIIPRSLGPHLDPTAYSEDRLKHGAMVTRLIFDATKPLKGFPERAKVPEEVMRHIDLKDYLPNLDSLPRQQCQTIWGDNVNAQ